MRRMSLTRSACAILQTADSADKAALSRRTAAAWRAGDIAEIGDDRPETRPARPDRPELLPPQDMPRRRGAAGRIALLHAIDHIELNAIDLAWDMIARFAQPDLPRAFYDDWVRVGDEEAKHFLLLSDRLAVAPLVLEARGLDVTLGMIARLDQAGNADSVAVLQIIQADEIGHVASGQRWFAHIAGTRGLDPAAAFHSLVRKHYRGRLKPPFNTESRAAAEFDAAWYEPLATTA